MHDAGISHTHTHMHTYICTWIHKYSCVRTQTHLFFLSVTHSYVCAHARAKQSWLSLIHRLWKQICLNAFIVSWGGEEYRKRCSTVRQGDLPSIESQWRKISTHTDVSVVKVHLLRAWCTNAEQLHNPERSSSESRDAGMEAVCCHL